MKKLTKTQKALELLKREDQLTLALKHLRNTHLMALENDMSEKRINIINEIEDTLKLLNK